MLDLPSDKREVVAKGLSALADFAGGLTLRRQRKSTRSAASSSRSGAAASAPSSRVRDKQIPVLFYESRYAQRLPIGKPDVIRSAPPERLRSFYDTWYRPERMAVVAVGDFDPPRIETRHPLGRSRPSGRGPGRARSRHVGPDPASAPRERHDRSGADRSRPSRSCASVPARGRSTSAITGASLVRRMIEQMIDERFSELAQKPDAKFLGAGAGDGALSRTVEAFALEARVAGRRDRGRRRRSRRGSEAGARVRLQPLRARSRQAVDHVLLRPRVQRAGQERKRIGSRRSISTYFLEDEPTPGIEYEYARWSSNSCPRSPLEEVSDALARTADRRQPRSCSPSRRRSPDIRIPVGRGSPGGAQHPPSR